MQAIALPMNHISDVHADAEALYRFLDATPLRWIVLDYARIGAELEIPAKRVDRAMDVLEAAGLVERAAYGPLLYITR